MKEDMYITLVSMNHFFGIKPFKKDGILKLIKEKDNNGETAVNPNQITA